MSIIHFAFILTVYRPLVSLRLGLSKAHDGALVEMRESSVPISEEFKMISESFSEFDFVRALVAIFEFAIIALHPFFVIASAMLQLLTDLLQHSRIKSSFSDCMVIVGSSPCWFSKPPRKPPDPRKPRIYDPISRNVRFSS